MPNLIDLSGHKYHRWLVIRRAVSGDGGFSALHRKDTAWLCRCDCGAVKVVSGNNLKSGRTKSCGCFASEHLRDPKSHGLSRHPLYQIWAGIKARTSNRNHIEWGRYGGRGIQMCEEWHSFKVFYDYVIGIIGERPSKSHSIERIDNNQGYAPGNIKWASRGEQNRNKRSNRWLEFNGEKHTLSDWARLLGVCHSTLRERLDRMSVEDALSMPKGGLKHAA